MSEDNVTKLTSIQGGAGTPKQPEALTYTIEYDTSEGKAFEIITGWLMVAGGFMMVINDESQVLFAVPAAVVTLIRGENLRNRTIN